MAEQEVIEAGGNPTPDEVEALRARLEATRANERVLPEAVRGRWDDLAANAARKRVRVEVRLREGTVPVETAEGDLRGSFRVWTTNRVGIESKLAEVESFSKAIELGGEWVDAQPLLGAEALRDELRAHARRLAILTPRDLSHRRKGTDHRIYLDFRDRILPLAWDNLVAAVQVERLEDFVRKVGTLVADPTGDAKDEELAPINVGTLRDLVDEARGLVPAVGESGPVGADGAAVGPEGLIGLPGAEGPAPTPETTALADQAIADARLLTDGAEPPEAES